ncbi:MAG: hypothetical protein V1838_01685 [Patescibacteria group bacterium]
MSIFIQIHGREETLDSVSNMVWFYVRFLIREVCRVDPETIHYEFIKNGKPGCRVRIIGQIEALQQKLISDRLSYFFHAIQDISPEEKESGKLLVPLTAQPIIFDFCESDTKKHGRIPTNEADSK